MILLNLLRPTGVDFPIFFDAATMLWQHLNFYRFLTLSPGPFNYPPTSFLFLFWLGALPFDLAGIVWNLSSLGAFILAVWILLKILKWKFQIFWFLALLLLFMVAFFPEKHNLASGQINNFVLLFTVGALSFFGQGKKKLSAALLAFATGIKLVPAVFILYFLIKKDFRTIVWYGVFLLLLEDLSLLIVPFEIQKVYFGEVFFQAFPLSGKDIYYNQSLLGFLARSFELQTTVRIVQYAISLLMVAVTFFQGRKISDLRAISAVACLYLILHPLAWQHHFVFAIVPLIFLSAELIKEKFDFFHPKKWLLIFPLVFAFILISWNIKQPNLVPDEFGFVLSHQFFGVLILWILAIFKENFWKVAAIIWTISICASYFSFALCHARICF